MDGVLALSLPHQRLELRWVLARSDQLNGPSELLQWLNATGMKWPVLSLVAGQLFFDQEEQGGLSVLHDHLIHLDRGSAELDGAGCLALEYSGGLDPGVAARALRRADHDQV